MEPLLLVVEDDRDTLFLLRRVIQRSGLRAQLAMAIDGVSALRLLPQGPGSAAARWPDLVLLDLDLPGMHGLEFLRRLRALPHAAAVPVVVFSRSDVPEDIRESYRFGANGYVQKPVAHDEFVDTIQEVLHFWLFLNRSPGPDPTADDRVGRPPGSLLPRKSK